MITTIDLKSAFVEGKELSLGELYGIFALDNYKAFRSRLGILLEKTKESNGSIRWNMGMVRNWSVLDANYNPYDLSCKLFRHIVAEQLLFDITKGIFFNQIAKNAKYKENFFRPLLEPENLLSLVKTWVNPLVWKRPNIEDTVLVGHIADETFVTSRAEGKNKEINNAIIVLCRELTCEFANKPRRASGVGFHRWEPLAWDHMGINTILGGEPCDVKKEKFWDATWVRTSLNTIADNFGGSKAIEILRMLQKEWPTIKIWRSNFNDMDQKDIEQFENQLMNGFGDLLEKWGEEQVDIIPEKISTSKRGRKVKELFMNLDGEVDIERTKIESERLIRYKNAHHWGNEKLDSKMDDKKNQVIVSFYLQWEKQEQPPTLNGSALVRFLTRECKIAINVNEKSLAYCLLTMIKNEKDNNSPSIIDTSIKQEISDLFSKR